MFGVPTRVTTPNASFAEIWPFAVVCHNCVGVGVLSFEMVLPTFPEDLKIVCLQGAKTGFDADSFGDLKALLGDFLKKDVSDIIVLKDLDQFDKLSTEQLTTFTHILTDSIEFPKFELVAYSLYLPVLRKDWLYASIKNGKVDPVKHYLSDPRCIFHGSNVCFSPLFSDVENSILTTAVATFGGDTMDTPKEQLSHYIAKSKDDPNLEMIENYLKMSDRTIHILSFEWILHSIEQGVRLDESNYLFDKKISSLSTTKDNALFLKGVSIKIFDSDKMSNKFLKCLTRLIETTGASVISSTSECFCLSSFYQPDLPQNNTQRTFNFFFQMHLQKQVNIKNSLLHYPPRQTPVEGMENVIAGTTNYTGETRKYIELLIRRMGGTFLKALRKNQSTHLIAASGKGNKYQFAKLWDIQIVNHCWIEDCFVNWEMMDVSKYHKLLRDRKGIRIMDTLEFSGFNDNDNDSDNDNDNGNDNDNDNNSYSEKIRPSTQNNFKESIQIEDSDSLIDKLPNISKLSKTSQMDAPGEDAIVAEDDHVKLQKNEPAISKEETPNTEASVNDLSIFEIQDEDPLPVTARKRQPDVSISEVTPKKSKVSGKPYKLVAIATGLDDTLSEKDKKMLKQIGINLVDNATNKNLNCIIAPTFLRTEKFLKALAQDPVYFLYPRFLDDILARLEANKKDSSITYPDIQIYSIWNYIDYEKDVKPKKVFPENFTRKEAALKLKNPRKNIFKDMSFCLSSELAGGYDTIKGILTAYGATKCMQFKKSSKSTLKNTSKSFSMVEDASILICKPNETELHEQFEKLQKKAPFLICEWNLIVESIFQGELIINPKFVISEQNI